MSPADAMLADARQALAEGPALLGRDEADLAACALARGNDAAALRWCLRALLAHPGWRPLARAVLGDAPGTDELEGALAEELRDALEGGP